MTNTQYIWELCIFIRDIITGTNRSSPTHPSRSDIFGRWITFFVRFQPSHFWQIPNWAKYPQACSYGHQICLLWCIVPSTNEVKPISGPNLKRGGSGSASIQINTIEIDKKRGNNLVAWLVAMAAEEKKSQVCGGGNVVSSSNPISCCGASLPASISCGCTSPLCCLLVRTYNGKGPPSPPKFCSCLLLTH